MNGSPWRIIAFYKFTPLDAEAMKALQNHLVNTGRNSGMCGLVLVAPEGINGTVAGTDDAISAFRTMVTNAVGPVDVKESESNARPFRRFDVKIRQEIVHIGDPALHPNGPNNHLSPTDWDAMIDRDDVVVLDARNRYETEIGMFDSALDPGLRSFQEFPDWVRTCGIPRDKTVLMYCTGGIRCEKASLEMQRQGFANVYQLHGGILRYLEEHPEGRFRGECFVFDHRTAVDAKLRPSGRYALCPHCGDPGDCVIRCARCSMEIKICRRCEESMHQPTCSKNCAYHHRRSAVVA